MILTKDGQKISLSNENHISAFLSSGWTEVKASAPSVAEKVSEPEKKSVSKKKQEK